MKCIVSKCTNQMKAKDLKMSFFSFPEEKKMLSKWVKFCRCHKKFDPRTWKICMEHFKSEDIERDWNGEMGTKRHLKPGAVPCIYTNVANKKVYRPKKAQPRRKHKVVTETITSLSSPEVTAEEYVKPEIDSDDEDILEIDLDEMQYNTANYKNTSFNNNTPEQNSAEKIMLEREVKALKCQNNCFKQRLQRLKIIQVNNLQILKRKLANIEEAVQNL